MSLPANLIQEKAKTLKSLLEVSKKEIEAALPRHLTADRLLRIAMTEARKNPVLLECTQASFIGAIIQCAQLGLEPGNQLGHAYLVPFKNKKLNITEVQFIIGYRGMMDLAGRSQRCSHVLARAVYEGDVFEYEFGTEEKLIHKPCDKPGKLTHVYSIAFLKDGGKMFDVMDLGEINAARKRSKASESGPWVTDFDAMAKKSVVRRQFKFIPSSIEIQRAIGLDEAADRGEQDNGSFIETEGRSLSKAEEMQRELERQEAERAKRHDTGPRLKPIVSQPQPENDADPESFDNFDSSSSVSSSPDWKEALVLEISSVSLDLGLDMTDLGAECNAFFKKSLSELDKGEMSLFLADLKKRRDGKLRKRS